jgi:ribosomal protein S10
MFIILSIYSKNSVSLTNFLKFFYKLSMNKGLGLSAFTSQCSVKRKKVFFSVLKSPHVNKTSQEQFEYKLFKKQIKIDVFQINKLLVILKLLKAKLFSDVKIELKFSFHQNSFRKPFLNKINPDQFILKQFQNKGLVRSKLVGQTFLKLFDIYGEVFIKNSKNKDLFS